MPDKKLTDKEIVKALECCHGQLEADCENCPNKNTCSEIDVIQQTLDLINRLQEENERLKKGWKADVILATEAEAKAEAYKECIEKVKENSNKMGLICGGALVRTDYTITEEKLDNLLKEMVGE